MKKRISLIQKYQIKMNKSSLYFQNYSRKKTNKINSSLFTYSKVTRSNVDDRDTTRKFFTKENIHDILNLTKSVMFFVHQKPPQPTKALWGFFFLSFELIIKIICNYPCDNRTNENCKNKKCNIHLYIAQEVLYKYNIA